MSPNTSQNTKEIFPSYIKYQFLVVLGASILILLFVAFFVSKLNRQTADQIILKYQNELLFSISSQSSRMTDTFENITYELITLSRLNQRKSIEVNKIKPLLSTFFNRHKELIDAIYLTDKRKNIQLLQGKNAKDQTYKADYQDIIEHIFFEKKPVTINSFIKTKSRYIISIHAPLLLNSRIQGYISAFIHWDAFIAWIEKNKIAPDSFMMIADLEGNIIYHPNSGHIGKVLNKLPQIMLNNKPASSDTLFENKTGIVSGPFFRNKKLFMACNPIRLGKVNYMLIGHAPYSDISGFIENYSSHVILIALASFFVIALSLLVILFLFYSEKNRLVRLHEELEEENAERKRSEEALRESEERFRGLAELLPITIFEMDPSGTLTFINRNGYTKFGLAEQDIQQGINVFDIISIEKRKSGDDNLENVLGRGIYGPSEYTATSKDGITFPVLFNSNIIWQKDLPIGFRGFIIDISDQVKAKEALHKREKMYHDIFNSVPIGLYVHDLDGYFLETNLQLIETLGYKEEDFINLNIRDVIPEKYRHEFEDYLTRINEKGFDQGPLAITSADGKEHIFEYTNTLIESPSGLKTIHGTAREITERIAADRTIKESEQKYRDVVELSSDGIAIIQDSLVKFANRCLCEIIGYKVEEINDTPFTDYFPPDELDKVADRYQRRMAGEDVESMYETKLIHRNGTIIPIEINVGVISYKDSPAELAFVRDITERKKIEEALRQSEEKHRTIIENIKEGYLETDLSGIVTFANDSLRDMMGYSREKIIGMIYYKDILKNHNPETAQQIFNIFNTVYKTGESALIENYEIVKKDGSIFVPEMSVSLIQDKDGSAVGFRSLVRDVTERRKAEQEKLRLENRLQQAQKMESIGTLAGGVAHDFNNLLMSMQGNVSLMLYKIGSDDPYYEKLKTIEQHIHDGSDLTKQLLGFARGGKYEVKTTDINEIIQKTSNMFARTNKEIRVHDKFQTDIWTVETDQGQISQVLLNLYVNAWQAMPLGGDLYISTENVDLDEKTTKPHAVEPGKFIKISVTDTGTGMDEITLKRIFEPFFTTKEMGRGTGLGLASAYGIIRNHGGIIDVYSEMGKGTTFNIFLPISDKIFIKQEEPKIDIVKGTETILFVDDEDRIIDSAQEMLEAIGYTVLTAKSGDEALYRFKENMDKIDIIILDMVMSGMGGGEVFDHLRKINPDVKVLLSSGYSINGHAAEIMKRGCNGFIQKPFTLEQVSKKIREILEKDTPSEKTQNN
ncbi:MAG: PAS domain S-box protein [Deltaproteobacteria bacterium]|nr:PAS domain S-box protein [Deltaproteobacteria bacterium]